MDKVCVTPDKRIIVAGSFAGYIKFWTFNTGELIRKDKWLHYEIRSLLATPDSRSILIGGRDDHTYNDGTYYILIGDIETGEYRTIKKGAGQSFSINLSLTWDKKYVLFGEYIWDWRVGGNLLPKRDSDPLIKNIGKIALLTEKHTLESTREGFVVENFQTREIAQKFITIRDNDKSPYAPMKVTPDGQYVISKKEIFSSKNQVLAMWDIKTGNFVKTFENCKAHIMSIDITTDGQHVIVLSYDKNEGQLIKILDIETGKLILRINPEE